LYYIYIHHIFKVIVSVILLTEILGNNLSLKVSSFARTCPSMKKGFIYAVITASGKPGLSRLMSIWICRRKSTSSNTKLSWMFLIMPSATIFYKLWHLCWRKFCTTPYISYWFRCLELKNTANSEKFSQGPRLKLLKGFLRRKRISS
jgi:hypothetical protein